MRIGVLALQGDVREHVRSLAQAGGEPVAVRAPGDLEGLDGLVIPGGESTTIGRLLVSSRLDRAVTGFAEQGGAIFGTCAGLILMAGSVNGGQPGRLGLMDIGVERNAYGGQIHSFEARVRVGGLGERAFAAVFIRAPQITTVGPGVQVLAKFAGRPVLARQGRRLAAAFHPELTDDLRLHRYFLSLAGGTAAG